MSRRAPARKGLALALTAAVLAGIPARLAVDAAAPEGRTYVESSHDPARCGYLHDHAACQQLFASAASPAPGPAADASLPPDRNRRGPRSAGLPVRQAPSSTLPRAPPHLGS